MLNPNNKIYGSLGIADNYVMKTEEGKSLILNNPKLGSFGDVLTEFNIYGRSEQFSTTGAQLLNENIEIESRGVTVKINGSTATFEGTVSDEANFRVHCQKDLKLKPGKYIVSSSNEKIFADFLVKKANDEMIYNNHIEIDGTEKKVKIRVLFGLKPSAKGDVIYETTNIMLNDGDIALPYEPYTGGKPSPSPDYPQEIKSVVNPIINVCGKNLLKYPYIETTKTSQGITFTDNKDGSINVSGTATETAYYNLYSNIDGKRLTLASGTYKLVTKGRSKCNVFVNNGVTSAQNEGTFTITDGHNDVWCFIQVFKGLAVDETIYPMIQLASITDESYEPYYEEQTVTLPYILNAIPVNIGGNYTDQYGQQWIADYVDLERGKVVRKIGKLILTGKENWMLGFENWTTYPHAFRADELKKDILKGNTMNAKYTWHQKQANMDLNSMNAPYNRCIAVSDVRFSSVNEFTNELKKQDSNGTPLTVYYVTDTPQEENLSIEEIEQYKKLSIRTPTTIVENNYNPWMKATYKSTESV